MASPSIAIPFNHTPLYQSPYLYIQAAGSDGSDGSAPGIDLRWDLLGNLGANQIPKGTLAQQQPYNTNAGFNKVNDYFSVYRTQYTKKLFPAIVDFSNTPTSVIETGPTRQWNYNGLISDPSNPTYTTNVVIRFDDIAQYDAIRSSINPTVHGKTQSFIAAYTGVIEVGAVNKLSFALSFEPNKIKKSAIATINAEAVSLRDSNNPNDAILSCRQTFTTATIINPDARICSDNIYYVRFNYTGVYPIQLQLETYQDFITASNLRKAWDTVGTTFSLSINQTVVFNQLENLANFIINKRWPKFVGENLSTGLFTVNVANYHDRWIPGSGGQGLLYAVEQYLTLSTSAGNLPANASLPIINPPNATAISNAQFDISYLEMLKLVATMDYHAARMLGLGFIDTSIVSPRENPNDYVYVVLYDTLVQVDPSAPNTPITHLYMTQPTSQLDYRLPPTPVLDAVTYGLQNYNGDSYTDSNGYTPFDDSRIVKINKAPIPYPVSPIGPFFQSNLQFCLCDVTQPVAYGLKYKGHSEANFRTPELSSDDIYKDLSGVFEVAPIPEQPNPFFTQQEREAGIHDYATYAINWFSRPSGLSNIVSTDNTVFPLRDFLLPPMNMAVQLIQPETPLIFTTAAEQVLLNSIVNTDKTLVRATFDWNYIQIQQYYLPPTYNFATQVNLFFKSTDPLNTLGQVTSVTNLGNNTVQVQTGPYTIASVNPPQTVQPVILPADVTKYTGSIFAANQQQYIINSVTSPNINGQNPTFVLQMVRQTSSQDPDNNNQFLTTSNYVGPSVGDIFLAAENMLVPSNWDCQLTKTVQLTNFTPLHQETITEPDGNSKVITFGGIYQPASAKNVYDPDPNLPANTPTGVYTLTFSTYQLPPHPETDVSYYKGITRIPASSGNQIKFLEVWNIDTSHSTLVLTVYDPTFDWDYVNHHAQPDFIPIIVADNTIVNVNFHPSYRVYLYADTLGSNDFDAGTILPPLGQNTLQTYMTAQAIDTTNTVASVLAPPVNLIARQIVIPEPPNQPEGPLFATRPDFYGKSTYTFDTLVNTSGGRRPFALIFYRANQQKILDTLYQPSTAAQVIANLQFLDPADAIFNNSRWNDLVNGIIDPVNNSFKQYIPGGYIFPNPDNPKTAIQDPSNPNNIIFPFASYSGLSSIQNLLIIALNKAFLPLTEEPVIYQFLIYGTQTSGKQPLIRDASGNRIPPILPTDPNYNPDVFDPFPMATVYQTDSGGNYLPPNSPSAVNYFVRFTDYKLDGASQGQYFYYAVELSNTLARSARSGIAGPIQLVNSYPAEAPGIKKVTVQLADQLLNIPTAVLFELNPFINNEGIVSFNIYRTFDAGSALSTRSMTLAKTISIGNPLIDDFSDLGSVPYGQLLMYRIVALRSIANEQNISELVPSQPSNLAMTNIVDVVNPQPPKLSYTSNPPTITTPVTLNNVALSWPSVATKATYFLYMMNSLGDWNLIYQIASDLPTMSVNLVNTSFGSGSLVKQDANGNGLYYNFKVRVQNSSGLYNTVESVLTI